MTMQVETSHVVVARIVGSADFERKRRIELANDAVVAAERKHAVARYAGASTTSALELIRAYRAFRDAMCECLVGLRRDEEEES